MWIKLHEKKKKNVDHLGVLTALWKSFHKKLNKETKTLENQGDEGSNRFCLRCNSVPFSHSVCRCFLFLSLKHQRLLSSRPKSIFPTFAQPLLQFDKPAKCQRQVSELIRISCSPSGWCATSTNHPFGFGRLVSRHFFPPSFANVFSLHDVVREVFASHLCWRQGWNITPKI